MAGASRPAGGTVSSPTSRERFPTQQVGSTPPGQVASLCGESNPRGDAAATHHMQLPLPTSTARPHEHELAESPR